MKKVALLFLLLFAIQIAAQERFQIVVKTSEVSTGVIVVIAQRVGAPAGAKVQLQLQCNQGMAFCNAPDPGTYIAVRLPKNHGMYECANVDLYASTADPSTDQKLGEYCLTER